MDKSLLSLRVTPASLVINTSLFDVFSGLCCGFAVTVRRRTSGMSSLRPFDPDSILDMVGMLREFGTKSVKFAWSVPCFMSPSSSSGCG